MSYKSLTVLIDPWHMYDPPCTARSIPDIAVCNPKIKKFENSKKGALGIIKWVRHLFGTQLTRVGFPNITYAF